MSADGTVSLAPDKLPGKPGHNYVFYYLTAVLSQCKKFPFADKNLKFSTRSF